MILAMTTPPWDVSDIALDDTVAVETSTELGAAAVVRRAPALPGPSAAYLERIGASGRAMRGLP